MELFIGMVVNSRHPACWPVYERTAIAVLQGFCIALRDVTFLSKTQHLRSSSYHERLLKGLFL